MDENKRSRKFLWILITLIFIIIIIIAAYFLFVSKSKNDEEKESIVLKNPVFGLSDEQAASQFNESFVLFLLASIGAQNLHNPPLSSNTPKIEVYVDDIVFGAIVINGGLGIIKRSIKDPDIRIRTNKNEAIKMLRDRNYISESFRTGNSKIELLAGKTTLFTKGYLDIYNKIKG